MFCCCYFSLHLITCFICLNKLNLNKYIHIYAHVSNDDMCYVYCFWLILISLLLILIYIFSRYNKNNKKLWIYMTIGDYHLMTFEFIYKYIYYKHSCLLWLYYKICGTYNIDVEKNILHMKLRITTINYTNKRQIK